MTSSERERLLDAHFERVYRDTWDGLVERRRMDGSFDLAGLRALLRSLYENEGLDWVGRGELYQRGQAATIAATEAFLHRWAAEAASEDAGHPEDEGEKGDEDEAGHAGEPHG